MANVLVDENTLQNIADTIRSKTGTQRKYKPAQMAEAISEISGGGITPSGTKTISITQNGTVTEDVTNYASAQVNVNVPTGTTPTGTKQISVSQNGTTTEDVTDYASAEITVNVPNSYSASDEGKVVDSGVLVSQTSRNVTANGTYDTTTNNEVVVNVQSSGGIRKAEGTVTLSTDGNLPTIVHNLGTQKVALVVYPISTVVAHAGYHDWIYEHVNYPAIIGNETFNLDFTEYNSSRFPDVIQVDSNEGDFRVANAQASPWTSQSSWTQGNATGTLKKNLTYTDNSITISGAFCSATYKWIVYALD